jgi:hypothetical protein
MNGLFILEGFQSKSLIDHWTHFHTIIAPTTYLNNWALVTSNITIKFLIDKCPFLLEALARIDINIFPFQ